MTGIADDGRRVTVRTAAGPVTARAAVVCAGPWTSALLAGSGIAVPSEATMEQVGYVGTAGAPDPALPIFICHGPPEPYGLPVPGAALYKIGFHHSGPVTDPGSQEQDPDGEPHRAADRAGPPVPARPGPDLAGPSAASMTTAPTRISSWTGSAGS